MISFHPIRPKPSAASWAAARYGPDKLLDLLGARRLKTRERARLAAEKFGIKTGSFCSAIKQLEAGPKAHKSVIDDRWEQLQNCSKTSDPCKDQ